MPVNPPDQFLIMQEANATVAAAEKAIPKLEGQSSKAAEDLAKEEQVQQNFFFASLLVALKDEYR